jgi:hypothetical protein
MKLFLLYQIVFWGFQEQKRDVLCGTEEGGGVGGVYISDLTDIGTKTTMIKAKS